MHAAAAPPDLAPLIGRLMARFLRSAQPHQVFDALLPDLLQLTGSGYGFIGEVWRDEQKRPYLKIFTLSDISWDEATRAHVARERINGIEFRRLDNLLGTPLLSGQPLIANDAPNDPRRGGLPPGHPALACYLGVPLFHGGELVGEIGLANRPGGYDLALVERLEPLFSTVGAIIGSVLLQRERELAQALLAQLTMQVPGVVYQFRLGADGHPSMPYASAGLRTMYGMDPQDVRADARALFGCVDPRDLPAVQAAIEQSRAHGTPSLVEYRVRLPHGDERWHRGEGVPERQRDGSTVWTGYLQDITERKHAELALRQKTEFLHKLTEHLPAVVFQFRRTGDGWESMPYATEGLCGFYGVSPDAVRDDARPVYERVIAEDRPRLSAAVAESARTLQPWRLEFRSLAPDGSLHWHEGHALPEREADGATVWHGYIVDISERKRYEAAIVGAEAAERANAAKTEFLSRMSHELRTPLNAVIGFAQLLQLDPAHALADVQRSRVEHIERAGAHLLAMINDVLDLSRIEAGTMPLSPERLQLEPLLDETLALVAGAASAAQVTLAPAPATPLAARADRVRLRQVLLNLLSNAVKYNRRGGSVTLHVRAEGGRVAIDVVDTGIGLAPEQLAHLWEPFNRLGAERSAVEGTGIGLALSRRMVELMAGHIDVSSRAGEGSTFTVWLPGAPAPTAGRHDGAPAPAEAAAARPHRSLLYAEDNPLNVELMRQVLLLRPHVRLLVARSGAEALRLTRAERPDLLLLDMHLGDMSGLDVCTTLQREDGAGAPPCIALSADVMPDRVERALAAGFADYLGKPLDVAQLMRCLDARLG